MYHKLFTKKIQAYNIVIIVKRMEDLDIGLVLLLLKNKKIKRIRLAKPNVVYGKKSCIKNDYSILAGAISLVKLKEF